MDDKDIFETAENLGEPEDESALERPDYRQELISIIKSNISPKKLKENLLNYHENDIADVLGLLTHDERMKLYQILGSETLSDILSYCEDIGVYFKELSVRKKSEILSHIDADVAVDYLKQLSKDERSTLIELMDDDSKREVALIGSFDDDEIGSKMTTNFIQVNCDVSVRGAMHELIEQAAENDNVSTIYVIDEERTYCGAIDLKDLIIARESQKLDDIIIASYPYVYAQEQINDCIERLKDYSEDSIPVLDNNNKLIGVITSQDIVELVDAAFGDDYAKFAGLSSEEDLNEPLHKSVGKRMPWLIVLLALGMLVSSVIGLFQGIVVLLPILVSFQSLVLDMSGNVGTQSLAVTIRVLTNAELSIKQKLSHVLKELRIGIVNGLILGFAAFMLVGLYVLVFRGLPFAKSFAISGCVGAALLISMTLSSVGGTTIPLLFKKLKIDPAVASGPLITTINDLVSAVAYYGLAYLFLINFLNIRL